MHCCCGQNFLFRLVSGYTYLWNTPPFRGPLFEWSRGVKVKLLSTTSLTHNSSSNNIDSIGTVTLIPARNNLLERCCTQKHL